MNENELQEALRQIQFNKTEAETLSSLVNDAVGKGKKVQLEHRRLKDICSRIIDTMKDKSILLDEVELTGASLMSVAAGIDGSFFPIGGVGGLWYVPMSVARIVFDGGVSSIPVVDVFDAHIEEIQETSETFNINLECAIRMMVGENKALMNWGSRRKKSIVFIDGPIVDPPSYQENAFIEYRTEALRTNLETSQVVGCVKKSRDRFIRDYLVEESVIEPAWRDSFPSDQHLFLYLFTKLREQGASGPLFTRPLVVRQGGAYRVYEDRGLKVGYVFFQKDASAKVLRLDLIESSDVMDDQKELVKLARNAVRNASDWTYPGQDIPLPVRLADEKCKIRQGCAEVLYDDIMSRGKVTDRFGQIISLQLR